MDDARDEVALRLAARMIEAGKPVFGICRGLQEINVLFGGTLSHEACGGCHQRGSWDASHDLFDHRHEAALNSVHEQGIDRLGAGVAVEALATDDGLVEAVFARACGGDVLAVQWHPEWNWAALAAARADFSGTPHALVRPPCTNW